MMDDANVQTQELLPAHSKKIRELEDLASAKAEENAILIEKIYQNHRILKEKINGQLRK